MPDTDSLQSRLFEECETAGWDAAKRNTFGEEIAHLHEEISEAFREWRMHKDFEIRTDGNGKPTGIPIEFADAIIGMFYNAELHGFDLMRAIELKHRYNLSRSYVVEGRQLHPDSDAEDTLCGQESQYGTCHRGPHSGELHATSIGGGGDPVDDPDVWFGWTEKGLVLGFMSSVLVDSDVARGLRADLSAALSEGGIE